jgi:hypothetical protein
MYFGTAFGPVFGGLIGMSVGESRPLVVFYTSLARSSPIFTMICFLKLDPGNERFWCHLHPTSRSRIVLA